MSAPARPLELLEDGAVPANDKLRRTTKSKSTTAKPTEAAPAVEVDPQPAAKPAKPAKPAKAAPVAKGVEDTSPEGDTVFPEPAEPVAPVAADDEAAPIALDEAPPGIDLVKAYLREIGRVALLTAEMEVDLAKRIEAGLFATEKLRAHNDGEVKIPIAMRRDLAEIVVDGERAKRHLLEANLRLVVSLAVAPTVQGHLTALQAMPK